MSFLNSVFELLLRVWASARDLKVRLSSVEAMGQMVGLITRSQLKAALPKFIPTVLDLYKRDQECAYLATQSLHNLLTACLLSESGPPSLDFENTFKQLVALLELGFSTLLNKQCFKSDCRDYEDFIRDLTRHLGQYFAVRVNTYLASVIQAFDAPWPVIQANAVYFASCMLSLLEDRRSLSLAPYFSQVFGMLVVKLSQSPNAIVRVTCSFALGLLLKSSINLTCGQSHKSIERSLQQVFKILV